MNVPFIDLRPQHEPILGELYQQFDEVFYTSDFILGSETTAFEDEFRRYIGSRFAIGVNSGTDALLLTLHALGVGPNDQVVVPAFTFIACVDVIIRLGAKPILVDVNPSTFAIAPEHLQQSISAQRTKAIILVHLFGQSAPIDPILDVARVHNIPVIEDVAQSCGSMYAGRKVGSFGLTGCFSFYPTKNLSCAGDGGCIVTNDEQLTEKMRKLRDHGRGANQTFEEIGYNSRLDCMQAALLRLKLRDLEEMNLERQENARYYNRLLGGLNLVLPEISDEGSHVFNLYTIQTPHRDELRAFLTERGIGTAVYYPVPVHLQPCLRYLGYKEGDFPITEQLSKRVLQLPIYPGLKKQQIEYVAESVREFFTR